MQLIEFLEIVRSIVGIFFYSLDFQMPRLARFARISVQNVPALRGGPLLFFIPKKQKTKKQMPARDDTTHNNNNTVETEQTFTSKRAPQMDRR